MRDSFSVGGVFYGRTFAIVAAVVALAVIFNTL